MLGSPYSFILGVDPLTSSEAALSALKIDTAKSYLRRIACTGTFCSPVDTVQQFVPARCTSRPPQASLALRPAQLLPLKVAFVTRLGFDSASCTAAPARLLQNRSTPIWIDPTFTISAVGVTILV
jgi:hypothetical protein